MKIKLGIFFLVLAVLVSAGIFNYRQFFEEQSFKDSVPQKILSKQDIIEFFNLAENIDYNLKKSDFSFAKMETGKTTFIHFWASWCGPCLNEIPEMITFAKKNKKSTQFILVSLDTTSDELIKFLKSFPELNNEIFIRIWDKDSFLAKKINVDRLPMTLIFPSHTSKIKIIRSVVDWKELSL